MIFIIFSLELKFDVSIQVCCSFEVIAESKLYSMLLVDCLAIFCLQVTIRVGLM